MFALSIQQPWAALIVHGFKTIEIRSWRTAQRGWILIHAAQRSDARYEGWRRLPKEAFATADLRGGILGVVQLVDCIAYRTKKAFMADRKHHCAPPDWFAKSRLFGFHLRRAHVLPFRSLPGQRGFFAVEDGVAKKPKVSPTGVQKYIF